MLQEFSLFFSSTDTASHLPQLLRASGQHTPPDAWQEQEFTLFFPSATPHIPWQPSQPAQPPPLPTRQIPHPRSSSGQRVPFSGTAPKYRKLHRDGKPPPRGRGCPGKRRWSSAGGAGSSRRGASPAALPHPARSGGRPAAALPSPGRLSGLQGMAREEHLPACPTEPRRRRGALRLSPLNSPPRVPPPPPASPWEWEWGNGNKPAALGESKRDSPSCRRCPTPSSRPAAGSVAGLGGTGRLSPRRNVQEVAPGWLRAPSAAGSV